MQSDTYSKQNQFKQNTWLPGQGIVRQINDNAIMENISETSLSYNLNKFQIHQCAIQPKLSINQPNDVYEQEADAVADKVMRMHSSHSFEEGRSEAIQRKCSECEEEEKIQRKEATPSSVLDGNWLKSLSGGKPLGNEEKNFFEPRMRYDFSKVRIHDDASANRSAKEINALAYTHANNIVFNTNRYQPNTNEGKKLLAHELMHVVQQGKGVQLIQRERELNADESEKCIKAVDDAIKGLEASVADNNKKLPDYIKEAVTVLKEKRASGKIKCYAFEGIKHGRFDITKDEIHYDGINTNWINETTVLHEAVHALHGKQFPTAAKKYGAALDKGSGAPANASGVELLKWKAWTEYWAYRSTHEYFNDKQKKTPEEIHDTVMKNDDVRAAVRKVREFDQQFDPLTWKPKQ